MVGRSRGLLSSAALAASGLPTWTLGRPATPGAARTLPYLAFASGGPGHVVPFGLLLAGVAVPALLAGLLPRPLAWARLLALAGFAQLSVLVLLAEPLAPLLPVARFGVLARLIAAGFPLPRPRARTGTRSGRGRAALGVRRRRDLHAAAVAVRP